MRPESEYPHIQVRDLDMHQGLYVSQLRQPVQTLVYIRCMLSDLSLSEDMQKMQPDPACSADISLGRGSIGIMMTA